MSDAGRDLKEAVQRKASIGQTLSAVAWSFFGVRRGRDHENDMARLNPVHVIIAGVLGAAVFVLMLVLLVRWVISSGVAGA
ncbi:MAG: DUF2970 domain-containing protein [Roseateles sp.]